MTPAEAFVVSAAERHRDTQFPLGEAAEALHAAVDALRAERAAKTPDEKRELDITYGQVVEGDEILSPKLGRWYPVTATVALGENLARGKVRITMPKTAPAGSEAKAWHDFDVSRPCRVRRGPTGQAVDTINNVFWSGLITAGEPELPDPALPLEEEAE